MSIAESGSSNTTGSAHSGVAPSSLYIPGYHFTEFTTLGSEYCENVDIVYGYRISDKKPIVVKYSTSSFRLEREYYIMKKLYQYEGGPLHIVRPMEYINLPSGLTVAVYDGCETSIALVPKESNLRFSTRYKRINSDNTVLHSAMYDDIGAFLRLAIKCTDCLEFYQKYDIIHGEIRLSSFRWNGSDDGHVKLWSFGSGTKSLESYLTTEGWRKAANNKKSMRKLQNSLMYVSPEKTGRTTYTPDHRSDIYSLGIVFFALLTGQNPFDGGPLDILKCILSRKIPLVHEIKLEVPEAISRIIEKMTNKAPDERYTSAHGVRSDLEDCLKLLKSSQQSFTESIPLFPLGRHDIASVFNLPKMIYGRQDVLSEMLFIVERCASLHKSFGVRSSSRVNKIHHPPLPVSCVGSSGNSTDDMSDLSETCSNPDISSKSAASPSFCSNGLDESDTSSVNSRLLLNNSKATTTIIGVYGPGGIGKSTLFTAVQPTARQNGYVAITKFDSRHKVPYGAVLRSLSQVLQQIISEEEEEVKLFYEHLKISLGPQFCNIGLMADNFVPELKPLLDSDTSTTPSNMPTTIQMDDMEARTRFHSLCVELFRAITDWKMTTLFLDDLHQADEPSLELIESLILSRVPLLIFISYRDQEVTTKLAELLDSKIANVHFIRIEALSMDPLVDFICDTLHRPRGTNSDTILPLAEIIFKRTRGNAFYVAQLLKTLERKKLIFFDWKKNEWNFDLREIEDAAMLHNNSDSFDSQQLDFMVTRLRELPHSGREILKWASFVGDVFSWDIIRNLIAQNDDDEGSISVTFNNETIVQESDGTDVVFSTRRANRPKFKRSMETASSTVASTSSRLDSRDPMTGLQAVLHEGYIVALGSDEFKWSHDRISQAAAELANPDTHSKIHLKIAQYMMEEKNQDTFLVADHLLKCSDLLMSMERKEPYRKLLIEAGNKGKTSGAHGMAFAYYICAIQLGNPEVEWSDDDEYETTLALHTNAVSLSWAVGEYKKTEALLDIIFANSRTPSDRIHAYRVQARYYFGCQLHSKGRKTLFRCLDELGDEKRRLNTSDEALACLFSEVEELVETLGEDTILQLPGCDDPALIGALGVMEELLTLSYWSGMKREMYYWACRILKLSFTKGPVGGTGNACMFAGLGYSNMCQKYIFAERLGTLGIALADKHGSNQEKGRAYSLYPAFLILWKYHHRESFQYFRTGMEYSLSAGDRIYVAFHQVHISTLMFYNGYNLVDTLQDAEASFADINSWSTSIDMNSFAMCIIRATKALQGHTYVDTPNVFDGDDGFNDAHFLAESCKQSSDPELVLNWYESFKMVPLALYGHVDAAIEVGYRCFKTIDVHPCHRHTRMMLNYFSLALIEKCRQDQRQKDELVVQVEMNQALVYEWAIHSRINYAMYWTLIQAELAGLGDTPDILQAGRLYEQAINQAREGSWYLELCVIHECAGAFYERVGLFNVAHGFIKKAVDMYMCHGSYGKARHLSSKFGKLLSDCNDNKTEIHETSVQTDPLPYHGMPALAPWSTLSPEEHIANLDNTGDINEPYTTCNSIPPETAEQALLTLDIVDMASILKSSQVMSSEIKFDELLKSMMSIILENSGAECGAIIVKDGKFGLCAYGNQIEDSVATYAPPKTLSETDQVVSSKIVNHTIHTRESIFIPNVREDPRFAVGPWFERTGDKSVICMPIIHKCTTVGCLLIEGTLGVFTQRHITVLSLLCQQMGISITNAFLFKSVQRVTMANMRMIEMQKQALEEARRSKEAADRATRLREIFLANMSHEIRTPFSGFYGMISLLAETNLDSEQYDLVKTAKESCEMLLRLIDDLLNFSKLQAGKVSLDLSPVVIEDVIADVTEMLIAMAIQKQINVTYSIASDIPPVVMADGNRLRQIIVNLLGNAIKFTHEGEITIRCSIDKECRAEEDGRLSLLFEVIDSGIGISNEQRKVLFTPFSQVDGSTTRKYGGTGLGLSICLQLVELMSGKIDVKSEPSQGSNFYFTMLTEPVQDESNNHSATITNLVNQISGTRILVIDKHMSTVAMVRNSLPGATVDPACSVQDLLSCQATSYPVIIVGLFMTRDPDFEVWAGHLRQFLGNASGVIVMHYPTHGAVGEMLGKDYPQKTIPTSDTTPNSGSGSLPAADLLTTKIIQENQRTVVRMAIPLRRKALLKTIVKVLLQQTLKSSSARRSTMTLRTSSEGKPSSYIDIITPEERVNFSSMYILAAEDNLVAQKLLHKQLSRLGFNVLCVNDGLEAFEAWKNHPPGHFKMAFFDHHMPKCDGVESTRRIRKIEADESRSEGMPIVALTADIQDSARESCINAGMNEYLTKPMNHTLLTKVVRKYCNALPPS